MGIDFNMAEITVLILLAIIFFGPEKLPELSRKAARVLRYLQNIANDAKGKLREELGPEYADLQLSDLNPKTFIAKHLLSAEEIEEFRDIRDDLSLVAKEVTDTTKEFDSALKGAAKTGQDEVAVAPKPPRLVAFDPEAT